jgi:tRNA nucleotidyltransferase/poly(A) polymerase
MAGARIAKKIADRLRLSKKHSQRITRLVRWHMFTVDERQTDKAIRRFIRNVGKENLSDILDLRVGDRLGGGARETSWRLEKFKAKLIEVQQQPFSIKDLKIDGHSIMSELNLQPGPQIGQLLNQLFELVEDDQLDNTPEALLDKVKKLHQP